MAHARQFRARGLPAILLSAALGFAAQAAGAAADAPTANWPSYFGNDKAWSYSGLDQINRQNVAGLKPAWKFSSDVAKDGLTTVALALDGVLYLPTMQNEIVALDGATGHTLWTYKETPAEGRTGPRKPLGLAAGFGMLFFPSVDHHLIAIDQKTGHEVWNVEISDPRQCGCGPSVAPILAGDKVVVGVSSNDTGHRGYIDAFDAKTGKHAWRFWAIPGPGEAKHDTWPENLWRFGTSSTWLVGSYDPELNLVYWGVGNPGPMLGGEFDGNKVYSDSLVALDANTGKVKWYFQQIPNDKLDYDSTLEPVLFDAEQGGQTRKLLVQPTKSGFAYVLDRTTGALIRTFRVADEINWTKGLDDKGMPIDPRLTLKVGVETKVCPGVFGARAIGHSSYSPHAGLWYNTSYETCTIETAVPAKLPQEGIAFNAASFKETRVPPGAHPFVRAYDPVTGETKWTFDTDLPNTSSLLSTAGDLVFGGDMLGNAWALDATTGKKLWSYDVGAGIASAPISYAVNGRQYVAMTAGLSWVTVALAKETATPEQKAKLPPGGSVLVVFALPETGSAK
jgi:alcohol dehydrogenase (cytochrome c)